MGIGHNKIFGDFSYASEEDFHSLSHNHIGHMISLALRKSSGDLVTAGAYKSLMQSPMMSQVLHSYH